MGVGAPLLIMGVAIRIPLLIVMVEVLLEEVVVMALRKAEEEACRSDATPCSSRSSSDH